MTTADLQPVILRTLVGSHAHGTARPDSDYDYREVFVIPTSEMLSLGRDRLKFAWQSENRHTDDEGGDEIAQWLHLCSKGAPNAVELCFAPLAEGWEPETDVDPAEVQRIGRRVLTRKPTQEGIIGYAMNSFRKIPERPGKWKGGMLRVLYQGRALIRTGDTSLEVVEEVVRRALNDELTDGQALDLANELIADIRSGPSALPDEADLDVVNAWLLGLRREFWTDPRPTTGRETPDVPRFAPSEDR